MADAALTLVNRSINHLIPGHSAAPSLDVLRPVEAHQAGWGIKGVRISEMATTRREVLLSSAVAAAPLTASAASSARPRFPSQAATGGNVVSVLDFIDARHHSSILDGTSTHDISGEIQSGINSGENLYFPGGRAAKYLIDGQLQMSLSFQRIFSDGWVRLDFRGSSPSANAIELLSTRRDSNSLSVFREAQMVEGFRLTGPPNAHYASLIFVEDGTFSPVLQRLFSGAGVNKGYFGQLTNSFIHISGNERSYVNDLTMRDCFISGLESGPDESFPPCGVWVEGCIESRFENTKLFYFDECIRLGDTAGRTRNLQHIVFDQVQLEPTKRTHIVNDQASVNIYSASACTFRDCRFTPGNGAGSGNSVAVRVSPGGFGAHQIRFRDCSFQGMDHAKYVCEVRSGAIAADVVFSGGDVRSFTEGLLRDESGQAEITFADIFTDL